MVHLVFSMILKHQDFIVNKQIKYFPCGLNLIKHSLLEIQEAGASLRRLLICLYLSTLLFVKPESIQLDVELVMLDTGKKPGCGARQEAVHHTAGNTNSMGRLKLLN